MNHPVLEQVARGIYYVAQQPMKGTAPWFEKLPPDARAFLIDQAKHGLDRLRNNVSQNMITAGAAAIQVKISDRGGHVVVDNASEIATQVFQAMLDEALK